MYQIMDDLTWDRERYDFIDTLCKVGIETLVVTNQSASLISMASIRMVLPLWPGRPSSLRPVPMRPLKA